MQKNKMHADELDIDIPLVRRLLAEQFPQWADPPLKLVLPSGTDHAIYRLGDELSIRLPRIEWATGQGEIDFGGLGIGDPACEMIVAWSFFTASTREIFRAALQVDDATWARGRGWALSIALIVIPYYQHTNPVLTSISRHVIDEILAEHRRT